MTTTEEPAQSQIAEFELVCSETQAVVPIDPRKSEIAETLKPIAGRLSEIQKYASDVRITCQEEADVAAYHLGVIAATEKEVSTALEPEVSGVFKLHRRWTAFRALFLDPLESARKSIKQKVIAWQQEEQRKAAAEQARLQAKADEEARRERERLEKEAAKLKTPELREQRLEQAAAVAAPVIQVQAPKSNIRVQKRWVAEIADAQEFFRAAVENPQLQGFVNVDTQKLARTKAANPLFDAKGIKFSQVTV